MFHNILFAFLFATSVQAQLNGEFWWLNSKLNNLKKVQISPPNIDIGDFQNDESAKIIFRDDDLFTNKLKPIRDRTSKLMPNDSNLDPNKVVWPTEEHMKNHDVEVISNKNNMKETEGETKPTKIQNKYEDLLVFDYPKNEKYVTNDLNKANTESVSPTITSTQSAITETNDRYTSTGILINTDKLATVTAKDKESQNICTYTNKKNCYQLNGFIYEYARRIPTTSGDEPLVCCILPIQPILDNDNLSQTIHFPRTASNLNRYKRSEVETNIALKQRDFLLKHKFSSQSQNVKLVTTPITKIVTPSDNDYVDPYWNIKNTNFQNPTKPTSLGHPKYDYYSEDYVQEYTDELPKPGLVGLYSDHAQSPSSWSFVGNERVPYGQPDDYYDEVDEEEDEDDDDTFGYSTIDPRLGNKKQKLKPMKLTTSDEVIYDAESHTINFQSNPDFHVFQGFKLLNLFRNTSRLHTKNTKKTSNQDQSDQVLVSQPDDSEESFDENQLYDGCGKVAAKTLNVKGGQVGEATSGSHPWMALVVLTKSRHNVLCYATLVHPRAAVTAADCVHGTAPGDITVISGLWDLNDRARSKNRVATVHVHPRYKPGDVENNLAVLLWMQPLKLNANIQPACLGEPQMGDECKFFGWGSLNQGIHQQRSRWQRATVRACKGRVGSNKRRPSGAFCVSAPRGTVTGMGGPLICDINEHSSIVGVVVSRENGYVLSPVRDWAMESSSLISGD